MKRWQIVYVIPLEVWVEIFGFPWITRPEFGRLVYQIGNFKFAEHAQFYLHEWGKRKLRKVEFEKDGLYKYVDQFKIRLDVPQTPLPPNIKSFEEIVIDHFDATTMDFLGRIGPLLAKKLTLDIEWCSIEPDFEDNLRTILTNLVPLLDGIHALYCSDKCRLPVVAQFLSREQLAKLKMLVYDGGGMPQENVNFIADWLNIPPGSSSTNDGPRLCQIYLWRDRGFFEQIFGALREQFHAATTPCTFALDLFVHEWKGVLPAVGAEFPLANGIGEQLDGAWTDGQNVWWGPVFRISRHHGANGGKELREWIDAIEEKQLGRDCLIWIDQPTIGPIGVAAQMNDVLPPVDEEEQNDQQKLSCSSKDF